MPTGTFSVEAILKRVTSSAPIKQALVRRLRENATVKAALVGGIHEGFAPEKVRYPFLVWQLAYAPIRRQWGSQQYIAGIDIRIYADESVDIWSVDTLVLNQLDDAVLNVDGQTTLLCHRVADFSGPDVDEEGRKINMVGGTYEVWTDQPH